MRKKLSDSEFIELLATFNVENYEKILEEIIYRNQVVSYKEIDRDSKFILIRHDIEFSLEAAKNFGQIENKLGVKSHFFFRTYSPTYTLYENEFNELFHYLIECGHHIGLHFEQIGKGSHINEFRFQKSYFEHITNNKLHIYSPHNPGTLEKAMIDETIDGVLNFYSLIKRNNMRYLSDSNSEWSDIFIDDFVKNTDLNSYQVLTHPDWWTAHNEKYFEKIYGHYLNNFERKMRAELNAQSVNKRLNTKDFLQMQDKIQTFINSMRNEV